jgi:hypothetical protein
VQLLQTSNLIATFGEDAAGNLYVGHYGASGALYRIGPSAATARRLTVAIIGNGQGVVTSSPATLYCGTICGSEFTGGATTITLSVSTSAGSMFGGWSGDPDCIDGVVSTGADRFCVACFMTPTAAFVDEPVIPTRTTVRAAHISELRCRVDALRLRFGLAKYNWVDQPVPGVTTVRALHIAQLRTALDEAYAAAKRSPPLYSGAPPVAGAVVRAVEITELQAAVRAIE